MTLSWWAVHPGEIVTEYREHAGLSESEFASVTGLSLECVQALGAGVASVDPELALVLERAFGRPASFWLNLQRNYDARRSGSSKGLPVR